MTAQEFKRYLGQPRLLYELPLMELQKLALRFPYSSNVRLLLLLKTHLEEHPDKEIYLSRCAAAYFDRSHLWDVLKELDAVSRSGEGLQGEVLELRELDELDLEPMLAAEGIEISEPIEEPKSRFINELEAEEDEFSDSLADDLSDELVADEWLVINDPDPSDASEPAPDLISPEKEIVKEVSASAQSFGGREKSPLGKDLQQRLARIRRLQEARGIDSAKEDVNRIARRSVVTQEEVASETLASLLVRQGQYQNAIRMYQRLILLYPEKKTIFAGLIKDLKEKL